MISIGSKPAQPLLIYLKTLLPGLLHAVCLWIQGVIQGKGGDPPQPVSGEKPPWHGFPPAIAAHCPPPLEGAGGGRVSGRVVGVFSSPPWKDVSG
jgi:hypothetical protein